MYFNVLTYYYYDNVSACLVQVAELTVSKLSVDPKIDRVELNKQTIVTDLHCDSIVYFV